MKFEISPWRDSRIEVGLYLLSVAIDGSKVDGIFHDPKLEFVSSCITFDLVPLVMRISIW